MGGGDGWGGGSGGGEMDTTVLEQQLKKVKKGKEADLPLLSPHT